MVQFYFGRRSKNLFDPLSKTPYVLSRSKLDLFMSCPRCFYLDQRLGVGQPPGFPLSLNVAVDALLKKEFDMHRMKRSAHPVCEMYGIDAIPFEHEKIDEWRDSRTRGIRFFHEPTNFIVRGGVDDIWQNSKGELHVVEYKATSKNGEVGIDAEWQDGYKRQVEIYQWLLRNNEFEVSDVGYFVYVNAKIDAKTFDSRLEFDVKIIPYQGKDSWIEDALWQARELLMHDQLPEPSPGCEFCLYRKHAQEVQHEFVKQHPQQQKQKFL